LSNTSNPTKSSCFPGSSFRLYNRRASPLYNTSLIKLDLPDPDTPVTTVYTPVGILTVTSFKLFSEAFLITRWPFGLRRFFGTGILSSLAKYLPVIDVGESTKDCGVPCATTSPPKFPSSFLRRVPPQSVYFLNHASISRF